MIYHFDFKTPGREEDSGTDDVSAAITGDKAEMAKALVLAFGGAATSRTSMPASPACGLK